MNSEAPSRAYRNRIFQVNTRLKALDEIYKIYITVAPVESKRKTMKSASGKRPPDEAHFCTAPNSKSKLNFVKHCCMFAIAKRVFLALRTRFSDKKMRRRDEK